MARRVTIKDIAGQAGVSLGTVHCALAGKPGVGQATRQRILDIAQRNNYRPNTVAASLKRKTITIAAAFPEPVGVNRFYFPHVWSGVKDCLHGVSDFNVECIELPYSKNLDNREKKIAELFSRGGIDGLLTVGFMDDFGRASPESLARLKIPVVLVGDDAPSSGRLCCVQPNYTMVGETLAELLLRQIRPGGPILLCAGNASMPSHYLIMQGVDDYARKIGLGNPVIKVHTDSMSDLDYSRILTELGHRKDWAACASVNARGSAMLGKALVASGFAGRAPAIGSDIFEENVAYLRKGVFTNIMNKNPYRQAYMAARCLVDFLLRDTAPERDVMLVGSEVVFQSTLSMYTDGSHAFPAVKMTHM